MSVAEEISPEDEPRAFGAAKPYKRAIVLVAGSVTHFITAFILLFLIFSVVATIVASSSHVPHFITSPGRNMTADPPPNPLVLRAGSCTQSAGLRLNKKLGKFGSTDVSFGPAKNKFPLGSTNMNG